MISASPGAAASMFSALANSITFERMAALIVSRSSCTRCWSIFSRSRGWLRKCPQYLRRVETGEQPMVVGRPKHGVARRVRRSVRDDEARIGGEDRNVPAHVPARHARKRQRRSGRFAGPQLVRHGMTLNLAQSIDEAGCAQLLRAVDDGEIECLSRLNGEPKVDVVVLIAPLIHDGGVDARARLRKLDQA